MCNSSSFPILWVLDATVRGSSAHQCHWSPSPSLLSPRCRVIPLDDTGGRGEQEGAKSQHFLHSQKFKKKKKAPWVWCFQIGIPQEYRKCWDDHDVSDGWSIVSAPLPHATKHVFVIKKKETPNAVTSWWPSTTLLDSLSNLLMSSPAAPDWVL